MENEQYSVKDKSWYVESRGNFLSWICMTKIVNNFMLLIAVQWIK